MRFAIFGGTGGTGRHVVTQALDAGHHVRVLVRSAAPARSLGVHERLTTVIGSFDEPAQVDAVVEQADAVISALGASAGGPTTVCADGIRAVLPAMSRHGVRRLVVVSAHGVADSHDRSAYARTVWATRGHRMRDKESMEELIDAADVDATIVRPPALGNGARTGRYVTGTDLRIGITSSIPRADLADFLLSAAVTGAYAGQAPRIVSAPRIGLRSATCNASATTPPSVARSSLTGRIAMVTGATGGMGAVIATDFARRGATVVLAARDARKGSELARRITARTGNPRMEVLQVDLADQASIRRAVTAFRERHDALHVLVNNAGLHAPQRRLTGDGIETNLAVNHLGWFLLTHLLLDPLRAGAPARIVNVASQAMADARAVTFTGRPRPAVIDLDDLQSARDFRPMAAYGRAKLAMVTLTYTLARRLEGTGVTVNALHPGLVATGILGGFGIPRPLLPLVMRISRLFLATPETGARTAIHLATNPALTGVTGQYFVDGKPARSPDQSYDEVLQEQLWKASEVLTGLTTGRRNSGVIS
jgi:NAD(P)-dependent dehydrogenase (short-subunit alcohol dehydrogenase family)